MRTTPYNLAVRATHTPFLIALGLALTAFADLGGCAPTETNSSDGNVPGSVVLGLLVENPPGQDPNDPSVPSTQLELESGAILDVRPSALDFGSSYSQISFTVQNVGKGTVSYAVQPAVSWASVSATEGDSTGERDGFTVFVDRAGLPPGAHSGVINVSAEGATANITLNMTVGGVATSGALEVAPAELDFGLDFTQMPLTVRATQRSETPYTIAGSEPWLIVEPGAGSSAGELDAVTVVLNREVLAPGPQTGTVTVTDSLGGSATITVRATGAATHSVTGYIRNGAVGVSGVTVVANNGGGSGVTDANGRYELQVPHAWYGSVSPVGAAFAYSPNNRIVTNIRRGIGSVDFDAIVPGNVAPGFFIRYADGGGRIYRGAPFVADDRVSATIRLVAEQQWELTLQNGGMEITEVWFPWDVGQVTLNDNLDDDVIFKPLFAGVAVKPHDVQEYGWNGHVYPGYACTPMNVLADPYRARIVAATMWPPRTVTPMYSLHRMSLQFRQPLAPLSSRSYTAIIAIFEGDAASGLYPWLLAVDRYSAWLKSAMQAAGEYPNPAEWFRNSEGWIHFSLEGGPEFRPDWLHRLWDRYGSKFRQAQFWGQMSNYFGTDHAPVPPLEPGEEVGCCVARRAMHPRYIPELLNFVNRVRSEGGGVSFYTRPRVDADNYEMMIDDPTVLDGETNLQWYLEWIRRNLDDYNANSLYLDVLGRRHLAEPDVLRQIFTHVPDECVCEGIVDMYPVASLISGFVDGQSAGGLPERTLEGLGNGYRTVSVPRYARYLLADRYTLLGETNLDEYNWGPQANHLVERQIFLLGAKFDIMTPFAHHSEPEIMAPVVEAILAERERVNWWPRNPQYRDRLGITDLPADVDVRHFITNDGKSLLAIENWNQSLGRWFRFYGRVIGVPMTKLSIIETVPFTN